MKRIQSYLPAMALALVLIAIPMLRPAQAQQQKQVQPLAAVLYAIENGTGFFVYNLSESSGCPTIQIGESLAEAIVKLKAAGLQLKSTDGPTYIYEN